MLHIVINKNMIIRVCSFRRQKPTYFICSLATFLKAISIIYLAGQHFLCVMTGEIMGFSSSKSAAFVFLCKHYLLQNEACSAPHKSLLGLFDLSFSLQGFS